jgi:arginine/lysine/ornithine decarboxylase
MVQRGQDLIEQALQLADRLRREIDLMPGLHVLEDELLGKEASHDLDRLQILMSVEGLKISGYQAADWLRANCQIDMGLSDHARILATLSMADDESTGGRLLDGLQSLVDAAAELPTPAPVHLPTPSELELASVILPRDAFFGPVRTIPIDQAVGEVVAEQVTPYPPGIPALVPGERINAAVVDYLRSGLAAGMVLPDPADPDLRTIRVVAD